jgi:hypothetical protein
VALGMSSVAADCAGAAAAEGAGTGADGAVVLVDTWGAGLAILP